MQKKRLLMALVAGIMSAAFMLGTAAAANAGIVDDVDKIIGEKLAEIQKGDIR